jgi:hypothetical protein
MNVRTEAPLSPYGRSENAPQAIKGLDLLENYLERRHEASQSIAGDNDWAGWDVQSNISDSSDSGSWIAVRSDSNLEISDIDDKAPAVNTSMLTRNIGLTTMPPEDLDVTLATTRVSSD